MASIYSIFCFEISLLGLTMEVIPSRKKEIEHASVCFVVTFRKLEHLNQATWLPLYIETYDSRIIPE